MFESLLNPVTFHEPGIHVFRLTATLGDQIASDDVTITVLPAVPVKGSLRMLNRANNLEPWHRWIHQPPVVDAGEDQTVQWPHTATLIGSVDSGAFISEWTCDNSPANAFISTPNSVTTVVSFAGPGSFVFRLEATDGTLGAFDTVTITVLPEPVPEPEMVSVPTAELMSVRNDLEALLEMMKGWQ
jgi:hypothetical protein